MTTVNDEITREIDKIEAVVDLLTTAIKQNPDLTVKTGELIKVLMGVLDPMLYDTLQKNIKIRTTALESFRDLGLSDEMAVKMVCGR